MSAENINLINTIFAVSIAVILLTILSFSLEKLWRIWRDRPRLIFYFSEVILNNQRDNKKLKMLQMKVCNIGLRPIILTQFIALGSQCTYNFGIGDELDAASGEINQIFPSIIHPGKTLTLNASTFEVFKKYSKDLWLYFIVVDSFGLFYQYNVGDIRWKLGLDKNRKIDSRFDNICGFFRRRWLFYRYTPQEWVDEKTVSDVEGIAVGSGYKGYWQCGVCHHQWQISINDNVKETGCPKCAKHVPG